jgi:hypothetical protein
VSIPSLVFWGVSLFSLTGAPVSTATDQHPEPSQFVSAFADICLRHLGDEQAQIAAAQQMPWRMIAEKAANGEKRFRSEALALGIGGANENCALTAELEKSASLADVKSAFVKVAGADEPKALLQSESVYWIIADPGDQEYVIGLKVSGESGRNLATFAASKRKSSQ